MNIYSIFCFKQYIDLARSLRHYSRIPAGEALTEAVNIGDMDGALIKVRVSLASKELSLTSVMHPSHEQIYKVTRMRCWRITTLHSVSLTYYKLVPGICI